MTEQERIEEINSEQLATATDRVLLASRFGRARPGSSRLAARTDLRIRARLAQGSSQQPIVSSPRFAEGTVDQPILASQIAYPSSGFARGSQPHLHSQGTYAPASDAPLYTPQAPARGSSPEIDIRTISSQELTVFTRAPKHNRAAWWTFAATALITSLISVAAAIATLV